MQELFETIRESCSREVWSRGVALARSGAVVGKHESDGQALFRVAQPGNAVARNVVLGLEDLDWSCDCPSTDDVCVHVAGAVIAYKRAREAGEALPVVKQVVATLAYRLRRTPDGLHFDRVIVDSSGERSLESSVASLASNEDGGTRLLATDADHKIERILGARRRGVFSRETFVPLLHELVDCGEVTLDDKKITVSTGGSLVVGRVVDQGTGFRLYVEQDPSITEIFSNGAVLCGDTLRPIGQLPIGPRELAALREGRYFHQTQVAELVTEVLPTLTGRIPLEIRTNKLAKTIDEPPQILLSLTQDGDEMGVLPTLVYGDPPHARIDANKLVHLQGPVPLRRLAAEEKVVREFEKALGLTVGLRATYRGAEAIAMADRLRRWKGATAGTPLEAFAPAPMLTPRLSIDGRSFDVSFETEGSTPGQARRADPRAVLRAWEQGASFVPLLDGGLAPLPADWLERFGARIALLLTAREDGQELPPHALPELVRLADELEYPVPPSLARLRPLVQGFEGLPPPPLPEGLRADLRAYQKQGVAWLGFLRQAGLGALLADDMGLGKTLQTICALRPGSLVVAPTSVLHNWVAEIQRFRPSLKVAVYHGAERELEESADVTLTTYAILRLDTEHLAARKWDTVVLDEAQAIKNPDSQVARAAYALQADFRVCLSGTPVENRLDELWSQFHFLNRGLLGGRKDFQDGFAKPIAEGVPGAAARLRGRIRPFVLRRLKREVAKELPPRTDVVLHCTLTEDERRVYEAVKAASLAEVVERLQAGGSALAALEVLLRLRQAACHAALVPGQTADSSSKVELLVEQLEQTAEDGHKALVFSQWTSLLDLIEPHLKRAGLDFVRLDGSTEDRAGVVAKFQASDGPPVMLLSLKAGGTGLNLTSADHVYLLDPWWNPAVEDQAADRAHRIGQERPVIVHRMVAENTVEERILALQESKRALAGAALDQADKAAALTREDLLGLLA